MSLLMMSLIPRQKRKGKHFYVYFYFSCFFLFSFYFLFISSNMVRKDCATFEHD